MIAPIELRLDDHGIPLADERGGRSLVAEFAQDSGFDPCQPEGVNDGFAEVVQRPGLRPATQGSCRRLVFSSMRTVESSKALSKQLRGRRIEFMEPCRR